MFHTDEDKGIWFVRRSIVLVRMRMRKAVVRTDAWLRRVMGVSRLQRFGNEDVNLELGFSKQKHYVTKFKEKDWNGLFGHMSSMDMNRLPAKVLRCSVRHREKKWR